MQNHRKPIAHYTRAIEASIESRKAVRSMILALAPVYEAATPGANQDTTRGELDRLNELFRELGVDIRERVAEAQADGHKMVAFVPETVR